MRQEPKTQAEWQEAVDLAAGMRALLSAQLYGLITGPSINGARCEEILRRGRKKGVRPSAPDVDLAIAITRAINSESESGGGQ